MNLLQPGARDPPGDSWKEAENACEAFGVRFRVFPSRGKSMYIVEILACWGGWRQSCTSRCTGGARSGSIRPFSTGSSHCLPSAGVKADVFLQCLTTLVMGGKGLSRPGGNLGCRDLGI